MATYKKLKDLTTAGSAGDADSLVGTRDNGDGTFTDYKYAVSDVTTGTEHLAILFDATSSSFTAPGIDGRPVYAIGYQRQIYQLDEDFEQTGNTINGSIGSITFISSTRAILFF
jgi:hypothetical protein